ncbi:hypothetical protein [Porphyromonas gingivicanis]|uniref:hypothetical protein n=1 Tax=Porphyromonas gingivicanis TaxID=266762 RepID=UPI0011DD543B|nr:hypothetical protein [Porphyromonas gingivicanis]
MGSYNHRANYFLYGYGANRKTYTPICRRWYRGGIEKRANREIYLTHVALYAPTNLEFFWGSRIDNEEFLSMGVKFTLYYRYKRVYISKKADAQEGSKSYSELSAVAHFCEDSIGQEVFQAEFLDNWFLWELVPNFEGGMHWIPVPTTFEAAKQPIND